MTIAEYGGYVFISLSILGLSTAYLLEKCAAFMSQRRINRQSGDDGI